MKNVLNIAAISTILLFASLPIPAKHLERPRCIIVAYRHPLGDLVERRRCNYWGRCWVVTEVIPCQHPIYDCRRRR